MFYAQNHLYVLDHNVQWKILIVRVHVNHTNQFNQINHIANAVMNVDVMKKKTDFVMALFDLSIVDATNPDVLS
jgi:hypothetical protein